VRISTASALRAVDKWKEAVSTRYRRYVAGLYFLLIAVGFSRQVALPILITIGLSLHFFILELVSLVIFGVLFLRLQSYRLANLFLRLLNRPPRP
jgi:hypothetical protein